MAVVRRARQKTLVEPGVDDVNAFGGDVELVHDVSGGGVGDRHNRVGPVHMRADEVHVVAADFASRCFGVFEEKQVTDGHDGTGAP